MYSWVWEEESDCILFSTHPIDVHAMASVLGYYRATTGERHGKLTGHKSSMQL